MIAVQAIEQRWFPAGGMIQRIALKLQTISLLTTMKKRPIHNRSELKANRRKLRNGMTPAEARLWTYLKKGQLAGRKFRRQHSVGRYILDFYCPSEKLSIELDGESHAGPMAAAWDAVRSTYLKQLGIREIRFENRVVWDMPEAMLARIKESFKNPEGQSMPLK